jgi:GNAT superfamily N-acetyltransferase
MFSQDEFQVGYKWEDGGSTMLINDFYVSEEHRGTGRASAILETLVRVAEAEGASTVHVSMGGGEDAEDFLTRNGFMITRQRKYTPEEKTTDVEGSYGVDAIRTV